MMLRLGIVVDNDDPTGLRRVKVVSQDRGSSSSDWCSRLTSFANEDSPVPKLGDTVIIGSMQGDTCDEIVLGVLQCSSSNEPDPTKQTISDSHLRYPGNKLSWISGFIRWVSRGTITLAISSPSKPTVEIKASGEIRLTNLLGSITLLPNGYTVFVNPSGTWSVDSSGFNIQHGSQVRIQSPSLTWNGNQVAVVGGSDSDGDITLS